MANHRALFITGRDGGHSGSSLYMVTAHWVLRCSGNVTEWDLGLKGYKPGGRLSTTFVRKRDIYYSRDDSHSRIPSVGAQPVEGGHTGHPITQILSTGDNLIFPGAAPGTWVSENGVTWGVAVAEIDAAAAFARQTGCPKAARHVGTRVFWKGF